MSMLGSLVCLMYKQGGSNKELGLISPLDPGWEVNLPASLCPAATPLAAPTQTLANGEVIQAKGI